jgi:hypothetical protein
MKQKVLLSIVIFQLLLYACNNRKPKVTLVSEFPKEEHLKGIPIKNIMIQSKGNVNLLSIDSFLVIQKREEKYFQIYNTNNYELLSEFGTKGRGPNEFIFPELLNQISYDKITNSPLFCVYDYNRRKFTRINIINAINKRTNEVFTNKPIPKYPQYFTYFFYRDDDMMIATPESDARFVIYLDSLQTFITVPYLPNTEFPIKEELKSSVYRSTLFVNKNKGVLVSAPILLGEIDFFDLEGKYLTSSIFSQRENLRKALTNFTTNGKAFDPKYYIVQLHANEKYIYALNYNNYQSDFLEKNEFSKQSILVFDWAGNPVKKYILDNTHFIKSFAVDWRNNRFYGYCSDGIKHHLFVFNSKFRLNN